MPPIRRRLRAAAFLLSGLAAAGAPALAQNETSNSIGPPQLKDFSLPGQRTTPPATPSPAPVSRPPVEAPRTPPATAPAATRERPAATPRAGAAPPRSETAPVTAAPATSEPAPRAEPLPPVETLPTPPPEPKAAPVPAPAQAAPKGSGWLWPVAGAALLLALAAFFLLRRRRTLAERESERDAARGDLGGVLLGTPRPEPIPEPEPAPAPPPEAPAAPRPWLELDIAPERAAATENEVYVRYALTLTNKGEADARNIRIDPRLFNAGAEGEMVSFFQGPIHEESGSPHVVLPPGGSLKLNGQVAMPNAELREIELAGRRIFVPMVAINVAYDWAEGGAGRTSRSWLVGREAEVPTEKMGPFRLDLGPRIYRSVGRREARRVMV
jgi:MYXO-CTERM domain-containing protein